MLTNPSLGMERQLTKRERQAEEQGVLPRGGVSSGAAGLCLAQCAVGR